MGPPPPGYGGMNYGPPGPGFQGPPPPGHFSPNQQMPIGPPGQQQMHQPRGPPPHMQGPPQQQQQPPIGSKQTWSAANRKAAARSASSATSEADRDVWYTRAVFCSRVYSAGPPPPMDSKPTAAAATAPTAKPVPRANSRVAITLPSPNVLATKPPQKPATASQPAKAQQPPPPAQAPLAQPRSVQDATQAATAAVAAATAKLGATNTSQQGAVDNLTQKVNQMRVQGGPHDQQNRGRGRGRGGPGQRGDRRESQPLAIEVPKEDYDFKSANAKFNKEDLAKEGVASPSHNGDTKSVENGHAHDNEEDVTIPRTRATIRRARSSTTSRVI
ncbi:hypothetical protein LTR12_018337 [Friedmanniomyces endolithicus]|nr:hypothetical protein LTR12_018337 [Friedmanniomyces endolithicus]